MSLRRILDERNPIAFALSAITWVYAYLAWPFPAGSLLLRLIALERPFVYQLFAGGYTLFLFTTPFIVFSTLLSGLYIFVYKHSLAADPQPLPPYPLPSQREQLSLVIGELHHPTQPLPSPHPSWLTLPERGLFTGIAIFGAIGSGKTSGCIYPFTEQLIAFKATDPRRKIGGLVLEVKGDFCHKVRALLARYGRETDYVEISLTTDYRYNPLHNDLDAYALAYSVASLLNNLFGKGKEPFWQQAYTNLVKFIILLHKTLYDYVTLFDVYECAINPELLEKKIVEGEALLAGSDTVLVADDDYLQFFEYLRNFEVDFDEERRGYRYIFTPDLKAVVEANRIPFTPLSTSTIPFDPVRREQFEAVKRWFYNDWQRLDSKLRTSIVEGISVFLSLFDDSPAVKRIFCPPAECYDPARNHDGRYGEPLDSFSELIESGKVCALNFPVSMNPGLAKTIGTLMKMDFQRAVLNRIPLIEAHPDKHFREVFFICDEYQNFATAGENDPNGDEKFFSLSRQPKCIPIVATQSISSLKSALPGETWRTLLQTFRTKIFLSLSDDFSARIASEMCGKQDRLRINYNISESSSDAHVSLLTGKSTANKSTITTSKSYNLQNEPIFDSRVFSQLKNMQSIVLAYDGTNPLESSYCYLKPYYLDPNKSYFEQLAAGEI